MDYTKGEWKVEGDCYIIAGEEYKHSLIADVITANDDYEANANLIAKSPQMVELLRRLVNDGWSASISMEAKEIIETLDLLRHSKP